MRSTYEIKRFKNSKNVEFLKALKLYSENIEPTFRTDTKEIMFWVENFHSKYEDYFFVLGFYLNETLIGFTELAYFINEKLVIVDYLVIDKNFRKNNTFYEFINKIEEFLLHENLMIDFIVAEVGCYFENTEPPEASKNIIRLLKMSRFGVVKCKYYVPRLGLNNYESEMIAVLMLYSPDKITQIKKETFLKIINAIYYKYYFRWYDIFLKENESKDYKNMLDTLMTRIKKNINKTETIEINGYSNVFSVNLNDSKFFKLKKGIKILTFLMIFVICVLGIGSLSLFIQNKFGIDVNSQTSIFTFSIIVVLLISSIIFEKKSNFFSNLLEKFIDRL